MTVLGMYVCGESLTEYHTLRHAIQLVSPPPFDLPFPNIYTRGQEYEDYSGYYFLSFFHPFFFIYTSLLQRPCFGHDHGD